MSYRLLRIGSEMQKALSRIISELKDPRIVEMVSVTSVEVSNDLAIAKVYVSIYGDQAAMTLEGLLASNGHIRRELARHLKDLRTIPHVKFVLDTSLDYASKIDAIIQDIHVAGQANDAQDVAALDDNQAKDYTARNDPTSKASTTTKATKSTTDTQIKVSKSKVSKPKSIIQAEGVEVKTTKAEIKSTIDTQSKSAKPSKTTK